MDYKERREKINAAVEEADAAFWKVIQRHFPDIKGGLPPYTKHNFNQEEKSAVSTWYFENKNK
jgi:hypothetical protein